MPPATRVFVYGFLAVFLVSGIAGVEAWPLTGWKLFSGVRSQHQVVWEAVTVDRSGREHPVPFSALPRGYRGAPHLFSAYRRFPPDRVEESCRSLADAVRRRRRADVAAVRVYRRARRLSLEAGPGGRPGAVAGPRTLSYECARAPERRA